MPLHLIKLAAGSEGLASLAAWQQHVIAERRRAGERATPCHVTRQTPKRREELLSGGSLYWVIKGVITVRQRILDLEDCVGADGVKRCRIVLDEALVETDPAPRKAFQGWRYLSADDAPRDLTDRGAAARLPEELRRDLLAIGAW